ncbi:MAG: class I SAM-dependent methyltransferase [Chloroflexota bacterium]
MTQLDTHYTEPRLVDIYDIENPRGIDTDFYLNLANEVDARQIVDLGCGTGLLTRELVAPHRKVFGVDPSIAMLKFAKRQPDAEHVTWIEGDAKALHSLEADLVIMTGNVAQVFLEDAEWVATLESIHNVPESGGHLAFESRNPKAEAWKQWNREDSYFQFDSPHGAMSTWVEIIEVNHNLVRFEGHNVFDETGEVIISESTLRFRRYEEISRSLIDTGFSIKDVYGDWHKSAFQDESKRMIFVAMRP